ncbi:MAG: GNAT family N-acetyltransferase [Chitinophagaceae bacterium]|nr:GNAT family N-acetyltransferase [Chitinophagaceae bacterium]MBK8952126.1 GNAT family N-acetyltransferase [Chitinophagaceae bacterium]
MLIEYSIQYIPQLNIDKLKWDNCISSAKNGLVYGYSFYLDQMADNWDALVLNDYEAIMPLTWKRKYAIHYLYQPFVTAQLGLFGNNITPEIITAFLKAIPDKFRYWDIYLNHTNRFISVDFPLYLRSNYILDLNNPYEEIYSHYRENIKRNIRKAVSTGCYTAKDFNAEEVIKLAVMQMRQYDKESKVNTDRFRKLYEVLHKRKMAITYGIRLNNQLLASAIFFFSHNRAYYILVGNHPNGKTLGASHALIDGFIKDHAGKNLLLDFEGSDIRNLAFFYESFGATVEEYVGLRLNNLPFYLKWLKK